MEAGHGVPLSVIPVVTPSRKATSSTLRNMRHKQHHPKSGKLPFAFRVIRSFSSSSFATITRDDPCGDVRFTVPQFSTHELSLDTDVLPHHAVLVYIDISVPEIWGKSPCRANL